jgi:hypothetical protein
VTTHNWNFQLCWRVSCGPRADGVPNTLFDIELLQIAIAVDVIALDILENDIGQAAGSHDGGRGFYVDERAFAP